MTCHVYLIQAGDYCKVGITKGLSSRLSAIKTSNPVDVTVLATER